MVSGVHLSGRTSECRFASMIDVLDDARTRANVILAEFQKSMHSIEGIRNQRQIGVSAFDARVKGWFLHGR